MASSNSGAMGPPPNPPPRRAPTAKLAKGFAALAKNSEKIAKIRKEVLESKFFDGSAPTTRARRERARANFEEYIEAVYELTTVEEKWNSDTFIQRTNEFLSMLAELSQGVLGPQIKAGTLWQVKHSLYWWACCLIDDFNIIWHKWHTLVSCHIHYVAVNYTLSTASYEKNNLSDPELALIFRFIMEAEYGVANLKQHWAAMLLAWTTAARPGSFTVAKGYQKGASLGLGGRVRELDETLRWEDIEFIRMPAGIAARVLFRFHKGYRNPHAEKATADAKRTFMLLPSHGERHEFDLSMILFGLAYERGLFSGMLEEILEGSEKYLSTVPEVSKQAVFVQSNQSGTIEPSKPMLEGALGEKLIKLCTSVGILGRNTYYSLRRSAIIETRRTHGTEAAKNLALHKHTGNSLFFYDNVGFGDVDITAFRLDKDAGMSREEIRKCFCQAQERVQVDDAGEEGHYGPNLKRIIDLKVKEALLKADEYKETELALKLIYDEVAEKLADLQATGIVPEDVRIPFGYTAQKAAKYDELLRKYEPTTLLHKLEDALRERKEKHKKIRHKLQQEIRSRIMDEQKALLKANKASAKQKVTSKGSQPKAAVDAGAVDLRGEGLLQEISALDQEQEDGDSADVEDTGLDQEALENQDAGGRVEPECWEELPEEVQIQLGGKEGAGADEIQSDQASSARVDFLKLWVEKADSTVPLSDLSCPLCILDPTVDEKAKSKKFVQSKLNYHIASATHSRKAQLQRAIKLEGSASTLACPGCNSPFKPAKLMNHIKEDHPEQLWEDLDEQAEDTDDDQEDISDNDEGSEDAGPVTRRTPGGTGMGKAKARVAAEDKDTSDDDSDSVAITTSRKGKGKARAVTPVELEEEESEPDPF